MAAAALDTEPAQSTHPRARHQHGTRLPYTRDRCHCGPCGLAGSEYRDDLIARSNRGETNQTDPAHARAHLVALRETGLGTRRVEKLSHVSRSALRRIGDGTSSTIHVDTEARLLSVPIPDDVRDLAQGVPVNGVGTRRRVRALMRVGWSVPQVAAHARLNRQAVDHALNGGEVLAATASAIKGAYGLLWDKTPDTSTRNRAAAVSRTINRAMKANWPPPAAWDDEDLDAPDSPPPIEDQATSDRKPVDLDEWRFLVRNGEHPARAARRLGVTVSAVERAAYRHEHDDILTLLNGARQGQP